MEFGPDGSLYVLDYGAGYFAGDANSALYRVDYVQGAARRSPWPRADQTSPARPLTVEFSTRPARATPTAARSPTRGTSATAAGRTDAEPDPHLQRRRPLHRDADGHRRRRPDRHARRADHRRQHRADGHDHAPGRGRHLRLRRRDPVHVTVTDPEDGTIDCNKDCTRVDIDTRSATTSTPTADQTHGLLGHVPDRRRGRTRRRANIFCVLNATYTDKGGATGAGELTGSDQVVLDCRSSSRPSSRTRGIQLVNHAGAAGGEPSATSRPGDWLVRFDDINLTGIRRTVPPPRPATTARSSPRAGPPTGQLLGSSTCPTRARRQPHDFDRAIRRRPGESISTSSSPAGMDLDEFRSTGPASPATARRS